MVFHIHTDSLLGIVCPGNWCCFSAPESHHIWCRRIFLPHSIFLYKVNPVFLLPGWVFKFVFLTCWSNVDWGEINGCNDLEHISGSWIEEHCNDGNIPGGSDQATVSGSLTNTPDCLDSVSTISKISSKSILFKIFREIEIKFIYFSSVVDHQACFIVSKCLLSESLLHLQVMHRSARHKPCWTSWYLFKVECILFSSTDVGANNCLKSPVI